MSLPDPSDLIKVHVTQTQREYLEFLVNRRIRDLERQSGYGPGLGPTLQDHIPSEELQQLRLLKTELYQAGT